MQKLLKPVLISAAFCAVIGTSLAQRGDAGGQPVMFGMGQPAGIGDLPPGRVRERLESLPPPARERALEWLRRLEFPAADLDTLWIDDDGGVLYVEPVLPPPSPGQDPPN